MKILKQTIKTTNPWTFALYIGSSAGIIWGAIRIIFYYLDFTTIVPGFMLEPYFRHAYLKSYNGWLVGWLGFILLSLLASYIYTVFFRKMNGPWPGLIYGVAWWVLLFLVIGPYTGIVADGWKLSTTTWTSELCIFILWGLFQGYTISEEFSEQRDFEK